MVKAVFVLLEALLFLLAFALGSFLPAFPAFAAYSHLVRVGPGRSFELDGILLVFVLYLLLLLIEAARKRLSGPWERTTLALVLALALGFAMKLGLKTP